VNAPVTTPDPFHGRPPPPGYGAQISSQGGVEIWRNLICQKCFSLVPDDALSIKSHDDHHTLILDTLNKLIDEVADLKKRYTIQEEP
jgi:hypothetical protein